MKKAKTQPDKKLILSKGHLITLTADQSNGIAGGERTDMTVKASISSDVRLYNPNNRIPPTGLADTCMPVIR
jgi:hypothetical protein